MKATATMADSLLSDVETVLESSSVNGATTSLRLELVITDTESIAELSQIRSGRERTEYAAGALRIGLLSLRHVRGQVDGDVVRKEADRLLDALGTALVGYRQQLAGDVSQHLKEYFEPGSGKFHERVERLIKQDGDLERVLRQQLSGNGSELAQTMAAQVGENSPIMKMLDPNHSGGLTAQLRSTVQDLVEQEREAILGEFSLDRPDSALKRLVGEISEINEGLKGDMQAQMSEVVREFSLDNEDSALSRLVSRVEKAQSTISAEFSLDNSGSAISRLSSMMKETTDAIEKNLTLDDKQSALARLKSEVMDMLGKLQEDAASFQQDIRVAIAEMKAKREESLRSTRHGDDFENDVCALLTKEAQRAGDLPERTGTTTGAIRGCKKGDLVVELGPETVAPGSRYVVEAKEDASYKLATARAELHEAKQNRGASVGVFVFSKRTAPAELEPLFRLGQDVFVVWDAANPDSDHLLKGATSIAKAICVQEARVSQETQQDFATLEAAITEVERLAKKLDQIRTWTETIRKNSGSILDEVRKMEDGIEKQVGVLNDSVVALREVASDD